MAVRCNTLEHVEDRLLHRVEWKPLVVGHVLCDSWYATHALMQAVDDLGTRVYCPIQTNRTILDGVCWTAKQPARAQRNPIACSCIA